MFYRASLIAEQVLSISGEIVVRTESRVDDENQCAAAQKRYGLVPVGTGQYQAAMTAAGHAVAADEVVLHVALGMQHDGAALGIGVAGAQADQAYGKAVSRRAALVDLVGAQRAE